MSYEEEDTCMSYEKEDTCMSNSVSSVWRRLHACHMKGRIHACHYVLYVLYVAPVQELRLHITANPSSSEREV